MRIFKRPSTAAARSVSRDALVYVDIAWVEYISMNRIHDDDDDDDEQMMMTAVLGAL